MATKHRLHHTNKNSKTKKVLLVLRHIAIMSTWS